jgi:hypothetical protein
MTDGYLIAALLFASSLWLAYVVYLGASAQRNGMIKGPGIIKRAYKWTRIHIDSDAWAVWQFVTFFLLGGLIAVMTA